MALTIPTQWCPHKWSPAWGDYAYNHFPYDDYFSNRPFWGMDPCCEWCLAWNGIHQPQIEDTFTQIPPQLLNRLLNKYNRIHHHFKHGFDLRSNFPGSESYLLAREVDKMSRFLRKLYRIYPWLDELRRMAGQLKAMGAELQIGPRRNRIHPMPRLLGAPNGIW